MKDTLIIIWEYDWIPRGKWLVTTIYKPWKGHLEGERCPT